ncbi:MAG: flavodoxin family protein [Spirochaetota bacterium]
MKVLALVGSDRKDGNTARIVQIVDARMRALASAHGVVLEFETLFLADHAVRPCRGCRACFDHGEERCPIDDDVALVRAKMDAAEGVIVASPVYVDDVSGRIKNWMDRLAYLSHRPAMGGKCAFTLATVGGSPTTRTLRTMDGALLTWGCHLVGRAGFKMGARATREDLPRFRPSAERVADELFVAIASNRALRPAFVSFMVFRIQKVVWQREPVGSYDRAYWEAQGWLSSGCAFYAPHRAHPIKVALARLAGSVVHRFVA